MARAGGSRDPLRVAARLVLPELRDSLAPEIGERMNFDRDIAKISGIAAVPTILDVVSRATGMGFTAIARVTEDRWITCASRDELAFGLKPGDELKVETTICHEIRQSREPVIIDEVSKDAIYCSHHTPAQYGFQSYISMPIILPDGSFFWNSLRDRPQAARLAYPGNHRDV